MSDDSPPPPPHTVNEELLRAAEKAVAPYISRFQENINRAISLVQLYISLSASPNFHQHPATTDILRAAVVLAHATLEDFLRTIGINLLPAADPPALDHVPLASLGTSGRPEKFYLGSLARFRGKTVDEVIAASVSDHLNRMSFNEVSDIASLLRDLKVDISKVDATFPELQRLMRRRHAIVHQAYRAQSEGETGAALTPVVHSDILIWFDAILKFSQAALPQVLIPRLAADFKVPNPDE